MISATIIVHNSFRWRAGGGFWRWWFIGFVALNIGLFPANYFPGAFPPFLGALQVSGSDYS